MPRTVEVKRIFELWIGAQKSGKTFALRSRVKVLAKAHRSVSSVWILDVTGEWNPSAFDQAGLDILWVDSWAQYLSECRDEIPRVIVFSEADRWVSWPALVEEAQGQGRVALVLDECYKWLPPGAASLPESAERAILAGRHLPSLDRTLEPLHMIAACQYPRSVHHLLREQAATILVGRMTGELAESWVRGEAGREAWDRVASLPEWTFTVLRGERPKAPGVRWAP
jgi:hypothetical protein